MSVRATERLIGDVVIASGLPNSPKMVVLSVDEEAKQAETIWFADDNSVQSGFFPVSALDRSEIKTSAGKGTKAAGKKTPVKKAGRKK